MECISKSPIRIPHRQQITSAMYLDYATLQPAITLSHLNLIVKNRVVVESDTPYI